VKSGPRKLLSVGALLGAGVLLIGMSVPANAFMSEATALAPAVVTTKAPGQELEVSADALTAAPVRDGFEVMSYAQQLQLKYANSAPAYTATFGAIRWPFPYAVTITDRFGPRPIEVSGSPFHNGIDFTPGEGTPIYAIADGVVTAHSEDQGGFGNHVIIQHNIPGQNVETLYAHMQYGTSPLVVGQEIKVGDFIGLVGDTGNSYGAHLHFEVHIDKVPVDPFAWLTANAV
jgi:murein DD-endopeptidase MepM/ murein hydrolase activator NlpD